MRDDTIQGIGSVFGGEYDTIRVEGIGKLKGDATVERLIVEGLFKSKGRLTVREMTIEGVARVFRDMKAKTANIQGVLKLRRAKLDADRIICEGFLVCNREVNADEIDINGVCSVAKLYGDRIVIQNEKSKITESKIPVNIKPFVILYFGRDISLTHSLADIIECTSLTASGLKSKIVRANSVKLSENCVIEKLYCEGEILADDTCEIGEIIGGSIKKLTADHPSPAKVPAPDGKVHGKAYYSIMNLYKQGKITAAEAEKMLKALGDDGIA